MLLSPIPVTGLRYTGEAMIDDGNRGIEGLQSCCALNDAASRSENGLLTDFGPLASEMKARRCRSREVGSRESHDLHGWCRSMRGNERPGLLQFNAALTSSSRRNAGETCI
jgi:hypothetical protein